MRDRILELGPEDIPDDRGFLVDVFPLFGKYTVIRTTHAELRYVIGHVREMLATRGRSAVERRYKEIYRHWIGYDENDLTKRLREEETKIAAREELREYLLGVLCAYAARLVLTGRIIPIHLDERGVRLIGL